MDCVAIGDTIAVGVASPLACEVRASENLPSSRIINIAGGNFHTYCVISAGSYDPNSARLEDNLRRIRNVSTCKVYVWVKPVDPNASKVLTNFLRGTTDKIVTFTPGQDNTTPSNYNDLAGQILSVTGN